MSTVLFANNAQSTLAGSITNTATTATLASGTGVLFPAPTAGQYFVMTLIDAATGLLNEIIYVTNVTGDTITMQRAREGTTARSWASGDIASNLWTAGQAATMTQIVNAQSQGYNYAADTGVVNAYAVTLSPALTAVVPGMPIRFRAANSNTGASTFNPGPGALPLTNPDGSALGSGTVVAGGIYEVVNDGAGHYQLTSSNSGALASLGIAVTGFFTWQPIAGSLAGYVRANGLTIGNAGSGATELASSTASALFAWLWNNFSNTQCPVSGGRGASASADFSLNKTIQLIDMRGLNAAGLDTMGNSAAGRLTGGLFVTGNSTTAGSYGGEPTHTLVIGEIPGHTHTATSTVTDPGHSHTYVQTTFSGYYAGSGVLAYQYVTGNTGTSTTGITVATSNASVGGGSTHNNMAPFMLGTWYIKL
jgi:microcystin-dependent protein